MANVHVCETGCTLCIIQLTTFSTLGMYDSHNPLDICGEVLVPWLFLLLWALCTNTQLTLSTIFVTRVRKDNKPSPASLYASNIMCYSYHA